MSRNNIPEILELDSVEERDETVMLLEKAAALKTQVEALTVELDTIKEHLMEIQLTHGLEGLRHNNILFASIPTNGRATVSVEVLSEYLLAHGVPVDTIMEAKKAATKVSEPGFRRELKVLS